MLFFFLNLFTFFSELYYNLHDYCFRSSSRFVAVVTNINNGKIGFNKNNLTFFRRRTIDVIEIIDVGQVNDIFLLSY